MKKIRTTKPKRASSPFASTSAPIGIETNGLFGTNWPSWKPFDARGFKAPSAIIGISIFYEMTKQLVSL